MPVDPSRRDGAADAAAVRAAAAALPLAQGDLGEQDAAELVALKRLISGTLGFHCDGYKERCLRRRIAVRMRAHGIHTYAAYGELLEHDTEEYERLLDALTINVSKFYRNPEVWEVLRASVLPDLFARREPEIRIWSAGCAGGEEPYTIAMVLNEHAESHADTVDRFSILATDIDRDSLAWADRGSYTDFAMSDITAPMRERWLTGSGPYQIQPELRRQVRFSTLDLIRDPFPEQQHLIFCRNVIIYFERDIQQQLFRRFHDALAPGGYLVLGKVEALFGAAAGLYTTVASRHRVFRRK